MFSKILLLLALVCTITVTGFSKPVTVVFSYNAEDVSIVYNDVVYKNCPKSLKIDFLLGGQIVAFKPGYASEIIKISADHAFSSYAVRLQPLENKFTASDLQVELKKAHFVNYVTNFTQEEVTEIINAKLNKCNIDSYSPGSVFKDANVDLKRLSIGAEVQKSTNKNASYSPPYYLLSHQKIKWYVLDNATNDLLMEFTTEGLYMAYLKATKGIITSERLKEVTVLALEEATQKFVNSPEFASLMLKLSHN